MLEKGGFLRIDFFFQYNDIVSAQSWLESLLMFASVLLSCAVLSTLTDCDCY
jgi:hypothetical protein